MMETDERAAGESAPLVGPERENDTDVPVDPSGRFGPDGDEIGESAARHEGGLSETKSSLYLFLLTLSIGGLQVVWSVELSSGSPYLLSLGMSKALLSFVWIASPLTGVLVQPYIGVRSDNCRVSWGKRKPFMIVGAAATIVSLLALAWVQEIVKGILGLFGAAPESGEVHTTIIVAATILMYCLDFAVNTVQAGIRCFIVDNAPTHQQESANAWAGRLTGLGNIVGYIFGYIDLPKVLPFLGKTRFQILCALASISLTTTLVVSCLYIKERDPRLDGPPASDSLGIVAFAKQIMKSVRHLPPQIAKVCEVQLAAWMGWFPFLYYASTYIGQLYVNPIFEQYPNLPDDKIDQAWEKATRVGIFALLIYAIVSFVANITLPIFVVPSYKPIVLPTVCIETTFPKRSLAWGLGECQHQASHTVHLSTHPKTKGPKIAKDQRGSRGCKSQASRFVEHGSYRTFSMLLACFSTFFVYTYQAGSAVIGLLGICWAMTLWAPFALISAEVSRIDAERRIRRAQTATTEPEGVRLRSHSLEGHDNDLENQEDENLAQAGIILGLHNVAISAPQILASLISSGIFKAFQKPRGEPWDDSVGWVFRFGGCAALGAAWLTSRLTEGRK